MRVHKLLYKHIQVGSADASWFVPLLEQNKMNQDCHTIWTVSSWLIQVDKTLKMKTLFNPPKGHHIMFKPLVLTVRFPASSPAVQMVS